MKIKQTLQMVLAYVHIVTGDSMEECSDFVRPGSCWSQKTEISTRWHGRMCPAFPLKPG